MKTKFDWLRVRAWLLVLPLFAARTSVAQLQETFTSPSFIETGDAAVPETGLPFPQCDPSLGTLNSVTLAFSGSYSWTFYVGAPQTFTDTQPTGPITTTMTLGISFDGLNGSIVSSVTQNYS